MIFTIFVSATRLQYGQPVRHYFPFEHNFPSPTAANEWAITVCKVRFPSAPEGEWSNHEVTVFEQSEVATNTIAAMKGLLLPMEEFVPELTSWPTGTLLPPRSMIAMALRNRKGNETEGDQAVPAKVVPTLEEQVARTKSTILSSDHKKADEGPQQIQDIVYAWWKSIQPDISRKLPAWNAAHSISYRPTMLLDLFMKDLSAIQRCKEIYSLPGDIKRNAEPAIQKCCDEAKAQHA